MATVNNPVMANITPQNALFQNVWSLTRCMKKAGWRVLGSSSGSLTAVAAGSNGQACPGTGGTLNVTANSTWQFPAAGTIWVVTTAAAAQQVTYTGKSASSFTGCTGGTGNLATGNAVSQMQLDSAPENDLWGPGVTSNAGAGGAGGCAIATPVNGRALVTGLSSIVSADKGRFLSITGAGNTVNNHQHQIESIVSATSVWIDALNFAVVAEGSLTWSIKDPLLDVYPLGLASGSAGAGSGGTGILGWWAAESKATTLKVPITAAPTTGSTGSDFIRGENVTQGGTSFEGELLSYVWDGTSAGYMVIAPRVRGSGSDVHGLSHAVAGQGITGSWSGAAVGNSNIGISTEYKQQYVFWKSASSFRGVAYVGSFDTATSPDNAESISALITSASSGITAGVAPGGAGTGNAFPTHAYATKCSNAGPVIANATTWHGNLNGIPGNGLAIAIDCIEEQNYTGDGSFIWGNANIGNSSDGCEIFAFERVDNMEDGDVDPFITVSQGNQAGTYYHTRLRTEGGSEQNNNALGNGDFSGNTWVGSNGIYSLLCGWRRRDSTSLCTYTNFTDAFIEPIVVGSPLIYMGGLLPETVYTAPVKTRVREPIWLITHGAQTATFKMRKGTLKHMFFVQGGFRFDTSDNKRWIQFGNGFHAYTSTTAVSAAIIHDGWDGSTVQTVL